MADNGRNAVVVLDDGNALYAQSTVKQISGEIEDRKNLNLPMIPVLNERGQEVWINANHITAYYEYESGQPKIPFGR
jgi:hypothetical protein